jgi:hypothetical protein
MKLIQPADISMNFMTLMFNSEEELKWTDGIIKADYYGKV